MIDAIKKRRTFAIISHPDAGKTTLTEKLLYLGGAIKTAGVVKARKSKHHATSDWMALERQRGISVTTSVMQFCYKGHVINLLDTPGHADFSEDTYRTLTAVDSALMVIDAAKGVEPRTLKLLEICRMRHIPILTFINKMDRDARDPLELLDEIESVLGITCVPMTWPMGMGRFFKGVYHLLDHTIYHYRPASKEDVQTVENVVDHKSPKLAALLGDQITPFCEAVTLIQGAGTAFSHKAYLTGEITPLFFGSALHNFGVRALLDALIAYAPAPLPHETTTRLIAPDEPSFSGFVFKIQANMDAAHRDRLAFLRICSGCYRSGIKLYNSRQAKSIIINRALTFMARNRADTETAFPGDIIGLHNHGTIQIGDTFTQGENLRFTGIPCFAPEILRWVHLGDPLKMKALQKGLLQLSEEGATQVFRPLSGGAYILGAVGSLQFDVVAYRLKTEYRVNCRYETAPYSTVRWVAGKHPDALQTFVAAMREYLAKDSGGNLVFLARSHVHLELTQERWPDIVFMDTTEYHNTS